MRQPPILAPLLFKHSLVGGNLGELVGKVEGNFPFRVGRSAVKVVTRDGTLWLAMNDNTGSCEGGGVGSCYDDNHGFLEVKVTVWRVNSNQDDVCSGQMQMTGNANISLLWRLAGHNDRVSAIAFSPDGNTLASGSFDKTIKLWDTQTGELKRTLIGHDASVTSIAFSPDGRTLASGSGMGQMTISYDTSVRLWDTQTGDLKHTLEAIGNSYSGVTDIIFSPDGSTLAAESFGQLNRPGGYTYTEVRLWDPQSGEMLIGFGDSSTIRWILSPDGKSLAIVAGMGNPNTTDIRNVPTGELKWTLESAGPIVFSPDGKYLASGGDEKTIQIWNALTGDCEWTLENGGRVLSSSFSPDGSYLASVGDNMTVRLWDTRTWNPIRQLVGHSGKVTWVAFSPDGSTFASRTDHEVMRLWDTETWEIRQTFEALSKDVASIDLSPDWRTVIYWNSDGTVSLYDAHTGRTKGVLEEDNGTVREITFSPNGKTLASRGEGKTVSLWRIN